MNVRPLTSFGFRFGGVALGGVNLHPQCRQTESAEDDRGLGDEIGDVVSPIALMATGESVPEPCQKSGQGEKPTELAHQQPRIAGRTERLKLMPRQLRAAATVATRVTIAGYSG